MKTAGISIVALATFAAAADPFQDSVNSFTQSVQSTVNDALKKAEAYSTEGKSHVQGHALASASSSTGQPPISDFDAYREIGWGSPSFDESIRNGSLKHISFTPKMLNVLSRINGGSPLKFYENFPIVQEAERALPILYTAKKSLSSWTSRLRRSVKHNSMHRHVMRAAEKDSDAGDGAANSNTTAHLSGNSTNVNSLVANDGHTPTKVGYSSKLPLPHVDDFYFPKAERFLNKPNGYVIAYRRVPYSQNYYFNDTLAYQLTYKSENSQNETVSQVTTLIIPKNADPRYLVSYHPHEDGKAIDCATSYAWITGAEDMTVHQFLQDGLIVMMPDFEGLNSAFFANVLSAKAILDGIRAVLSTSNIFGFSANQVLMYGYSAGSAVTGKAAELMDSYAPEFNMDDDSTEAAIVGMAIGGFSGANVLKTMDKINKGAWAGFVLASGLGISSEYPEYKKILDNDIKSEYKDLVDSVNGFCSDHIVQNFIGRDIFSYFTSGRSLNTQEPVASIIKEQSCGKNAPRLPVMVFQSITDESAPSESVDDVVSYYCQQGTPVMYHRDEARSHLEEETLNSKYVPEFFNAIRAGKAPGACSDFNDAVQNSYSPTNSASKVQSSSNGTDASASPAVSSGGAKAAASSTTASPEAADASAKAAASSTTASPEAADASAKAAASSTTASPAATDASAKADADAPAAASDKATASPAAASAKAAPSAAANKAAKGDVSPNAEASSSTKGASATAAATSLNAHDAAIASVESAQASVSQQDAQATASGKARRTALKRTKQRL